MRTINNLNITSLTCRNLVESYGFGKGYECRLALPVTIELNEKLELICKEIGTKKTELIRAAILAILDSCKEIIDENDY